MREIKFRAYIKDEGRLLNVNLIDFDDEYVRVWDEYGENEEDWFLKDCELMQYTGLQLRLKRCFRHKKSRPMRTTLMNSW